MTETTITLVNIRTMPVFFRMLTAKSRSVRGASHQPAFMGSCLTICQMCLPCPLSGWIRIQSWALVVGINCKIKNPAVLGSMVVMVSKFVICGYEAKFVLSYCPRNWRVETIGERDHKVMCRGRQLCLAEWGAGRLGKDRKPNFVGRGEAEIESAIL